MRSFGGCHCTSFNHFENYGTGGRGQVAIFLCAVMISGARLV